MKPIEFTVSVHTAKQRRSVKVYIYHSVPELRAGADRYDQQNQMGYCDNSHILGVTHHFERINVETDESHPNVAIIRLAKQHLTMRVISHEAAHAATWIYRLDVSQEPPEPDKIDDEEVFCHLVSDIAAEIVSQIYKRELIAEPTEV